MFQQYLTKFTELLANYSPVSYVVLAIILVFILNILVKKIPAPTQLTKLVDQAVVAAEYSFNSGEGKQKLEFAKKWMKDNFSILPWYIRILANSFLEEKRLIDLIESSLNRLSVAFGTGRVIDLVGNEETVKAKIEVKKED
jgi:phage holin, LL-H family